LSAVLSAVASAVADKETLAVRGSSASGLPPSLQGLARSACERSASETPCKPLQFHPLHNHFAPLRALADPVAKWLLQEALNQNSKRCERSLSFGSKLRVPRPTADPVGRFAPSKAGRQSGALRA